MPVVFEDENFNFSNNGQHVTAAERYEQKVQVRSSPLNQGIMLFFAILCLLGAYYIPKYLKPSQKEVVIYLEDITESRMRLIPQDQRDSFISSLPSRSN